MEKERKMMQFCNKDGWETYIMCDELAMAVAIDPSVATQIAKRPASIELSGNLTRGQMVVDWNKRTLATPSVNIIQQIDIGKFKRMLHQIYTSD